MHFLNIFIRTVLQLYFLESRCLLIFSDSFEELLISDLKFHLPAILVHVDENGKFNNSVPFNYFGCQGILVHTKNPSDIVKEIERAIRYDTLERYNTRKYLVMANGDYENNTTDTDYMSYKARADKSKLLLDIFKLTELEYISNFVLALYINTYDYYKKDHDMASKLANSNGIIDVYTHRFIGINDSQAVLHLLTWHSNKEMSNFANVNFYPDKLRNGQGKLFRIATFTYKPYSVPEFNEGTELQIAVEFSQQYNLTPYYVIDEVGEWGEIYDNWTGYGILGNVMNDNGDVGLAALYTWAHEYTYLDLSKPAVRTGITCLTPMPHLAGGWLVPLFSFTYEMWIAVGITFFVCSLVSALVDHYSQDVKNLNCYLATTLAANSIFDTSAIFLLQAFNRFGHAALSKNLLHGCMFLFCLLITSSYSSGLASSLTIPRYVGAINTVQELVDSGIQWGATSTAWIMSIMNTEEYNYQALVERFVKSDGARLKKYNNKRFAFSIERLPAGQFAIGDYITEEGTANLKLMQEDIYWEQCVLMTKKSSIWIPLIDNFILILAQTGIPKVWEYRVATKHLNAKIQRAVQYTAHHSDASNVPVKLAWTHVQGAFAILMIGTILGFLCFIIELLNKKKEKSLYPRDFN